MNRAHLFELGDQPWLPRTLRGYLTDLLSYQTGALYRPALPVLADWLRRCGARSVVDLCSGAGGPWTALRPELVAMGLPLHVTLTDRYPDATAARDTGLEYWSARVDARDVPADVVGARTLFTSLHHFRPDEVRAILRSAAARGIPIAAFEFTERTWGNVAGMLLAPLLVWRDTLALPRRDAWRVFWTFVIPVVPLVYVWDGMVSHLRSYTDAELRALADDAAGPGFEFQVGVIRTGNDTVRYVVGWANG